MQVHVPHFSLYCAVGVDADMSVVSSSMSESASGSSNDKIVKHVDPNATVLTANIAPKENTVPRPIPTATLPFQRELYVLIADDEKINLRLATRMLQKLGCVAHCVDDGEDVVDALITSHRCE
jgi:PleD family two-component response regulator